MKAEKLRLTGSVNVEITNPSANNRSLNSTFLDVSKTLGASVGLRTGPRITGTPEHRGGHLILRAGLPATRLIVNKTAAGSLETVLRGIGTVEQITASSSIIEPRIQPGTPDTLTVNGDFAMNTFSILRMEIRPSLTSSLIKAKGGVSLSASDFEILIVGNRPAHGDSLLLIDKTSSGNISGTFRQLPQNGLIAAMDGRSVYQIDYRGGTGNNLVATRVIAPAPSITTTSLAPSTISPDDPWFLTVAGTAVGHQLMDVQVSTDLASGFTHHSNVQAGRSGNFSKIIAVPKSEKRYFVRLATVDTN